jgi:hypothetical protein
MLMVFAVTYVKPMSTLIATCRLMILMGLIGQYQQLAAFKYTIHSGLAQQMTVIL